MSGTMATPHSKPQMSEMTHFSVSWWPSLCVSCKMNVEMFTPSATNHFTPHQQRLHVSEGMWFPPPQLTSPFPSLFTHYLHWIKACIFLTYSLTSLLPICTSCVWVKACHFLACSSFTFSVGAQTKQKKLTQYAFNVRKLPADVIPDQCTCKVSQSCYCHHCLHGL